MKLSLNYYELKMLRTLVLINYSVSEQWGLILLKTQGSKGLFIIVISMTA